MDVFQFFEIIFTQSFNLLNQPIDFGNGIKVTLFGIFIGVALLSLVVSVIRKLYF